MKRGAGIALRAVTATVGGYALAAGTAAALSLALPAVQDRAEAVLTATMAALAPCVLVVIGAFAAASAVRAAAWVAGLAAAAWGLAGALGTLTGGGP